MVVKSKGVEIFQALIIYLLLFSPPRNPDNQVKLHSQDATDDPTNFLIESVTEVPSNRTLVEAPQVGKEPRGGLFEDSHKMKE